MPKARPSTPPPAATRHGVHAHARRNITNTQEQFDAQDRKAKRAGFASWAAWVRYLTRIDNVKGISE